jgi:hypothetical protein
VRLLAVIGLVGVVIATSPATASPRSCPPIAIVSGEATVVAPILEQLTNQGIGLARDADCPVVEATVAREHAALVVTLRDPSGRRRNRTLTNARVAAIWIESWVSSDVATPLLAVRVAAHPPSSVAPVDSRRVAPVAVDTRVAFTAFLASGSGNDESRWDALTIAGRYRFGRLRVGAGGRLADNQSYSNEQAFTQARRRSSELLLFGELPLAFGRAVVAPRVGLGLGWLATSRMEEAMPECDDPNSPECPPEPLPPMADGFAVSSTGARAELGVTLSIPIADRVALDLGVSYQVAPFSHGGVFLPPELDDSGDPTDPDADGSDPEIDPGLALPGEPRSLIWWGLGLRIGGL